jgi:hypothetical protein
MPYIINKFNGVKVATIEDGTVDNTLDIKLVGKNYAGYGEIQNENMVHMLENFAGTTSPPRKVTGQLWYDSLAKKLKFYDGIQFRTTGGAEVGQTQPSGLSIGDFWFNTNTNQLFAWDGDEYILVGPQAVENAGTTELRSESVFDDQNIARPIVKALVNASIVFIISNSGFTLRSDSPLRTDNAFTVIKKGITLANTNSYGISDDRSNNPWILWATASSARGLVDSTGALLTAADFIKSGNVTFNSVVRFRDPGWTLGDNNEVSFTYARGAETGPILYNSANDIGLIFKTKISTSTVEKTSLKLLGNDILPGEHGVSKIGTGSNNRFAEVYSENFYGAFRGVADKAIELQVAGNYRTAAEGATANSVAVRDASGNLTANVFVGVAQRATNVVGGDTGKLLYQSAQNVTAFLNLGATDQVLTSGPTNTLVWRTARDLLGSIQATQLDVTNETNPGNYFMTFVGSTTGPQSFKVHTTGISYNPGNKTLTADFLDGTASRAKYADLAENYLTDNEYEIGTVLMVGGSKEVTACQVGRRAFGVVSAKPAYLMNSDLENGTAVALKGRVPVKVRGTVVKGQKLVAGEDGTAIVSPISSGDVFAIALESSDDHNVKLVESIIL